MSHKFWDKRAEGYDKLVDNYSDSYSRTYEILKQYLSPEDTILDFGCGTGNVSINLSSFVQSIHAIDISNGMLDIARQKKKEKNIENINFSQKSIFDKSLLKESYDAIIAMNVLHLIREDQKTVKQIYKLLKPGGVFISATACLQQKRTLSNFLILPLSKLGILPYIKEFDLEKLKRLVSTNGFKIELTEQLHNNPPNYLMIANKKAKA